MDRSWGTMDRSRGTMDRSWISGTNISKLLFFDFDSWSVHEADPGTVQADFEFPPECLQRIFPELKVYRV